MPRVSVIILNWNGKKFLKECLESLAAQAFRDFETVLLDNGSQDGSVAYLCEAFPWVRVIELPENIGFAAGNNRALTECCGNYVVTLNNDTKVHPDFLVELLQAVESDSSIGMVAAKMLNFYETGRIDSVGISVAANGMGHNIGVGEQDYGQYDAPAEVFGPCAGAALYRRKMLDETGFFDPDFFAYYEDLDLAWRCRLAGWRCVTAPHAIVHHVHSATAGRMSAFTVFHIHRNKWYAIIKNWPLELLLRHLPRILAYDVASVILAALRGRLVPALKARLQVLVKISVLLVRRREVAILRRIGAGEISRLLDTGGSLLKIFKRKMGAGV